MSVNTITAVAIYRWGKRGYVKMITREEVIKKLAEMYNQSEEVVEEKFSELEERCSILGTPTFLYDDGRTFSVEIESHWNEDENEYLYTIDENWAS